MTGANNPCGIGAAIAKAFAAQGANIFIHYFRHFRRSDSERNESAGGGPGEVFYNEQQAVSGESVLKSVRDMGRKSLCLEADFSESRFIPDLFNEAEKVLGPVSVLINNAAYWEGDTFVPAGAELANKLNETWTDRPRTISAQSYDRIFNVNTRAPALLMAEFVRRHIGRGAKWGRIINVSTAGAYCFPSEISYGASKLASKDTLAAQPWSWDVGASPSMRFHLGQYRLGG